MFTEMKRWPLQSRTHLTRVARGWLDMIMCCWHQKKCWRAQRATAGGKHVIYGRGNGLASAGATLPSISHTNLDARVWLWLPAIGWCITWTAVSTQQDKISRAARVALDLFKRQLLQLGSMQLALCAHCITAEGEDSLFVNREQILVTFVPTVIWIQAAEICKWTPTHCMLDNTGHGLPGYRVTSGLLWAATSRFPHTLPGFKQTYDLIVLGRNIIHSWKPGVIKSIIWAVVEVMMKSSIQE